MDIAKLKQRHKDFDIFARALEGTNDTDPDFPIIREIAIKYGFEPLWFTFVYVAFCRLNTAIYFCGVVPTYQTWLNSPKTRGWYIDKMKRKEFIFGRERRGTGRTLTSQLAILDNVADMLKLNKITKEFQKQSYEYLKEKIEELPQHSSWASFKILEILNKSFDFKQIEVNDLCISNRSPDSFRGALGGLKQLYGVTEDCDVSMYPMFEDFGVKLAKEYDTTISAVETFLCKWQKICVGNYYVTKDTHELDEMREVLGEQDYESIMGKHFDERIWKDVRGIQKKWNKSYIEGGKLHYAEYANLKIKHKVDITQIIIETI